MKWKTSTRRVKRTNSRGKKKMNEIDISKESDEGLLEIRAEKGNTGRLEVYFRHPILADVIAAMALGNYPKSEFAPEYGPVLMDFPDPKAKSLGFIATRPAIYQATKNVEGGADFDFTKLPRGILFSNPEALKNGFSLFVDLKSPVAPDALRKWGKHLMDGANDVISAATPYKMTWVASEAPLPKV